MGAPALPQDVNGNPILALQPGVHEKVAYTGTAGTTTVPVGLVRGTATILSNNTIPSDGDTITIGPVTYTFKTALTPTGGQVLINGSADAALLNLIRAINHSGTPGTDYANSAPTAVAHPYVTAAASVTSHSFVITETAAAVLAGRGNSITITTPVGATLTGSSTVTSGAKQATAEIARVVLTSAGYIKVSAAGTAATTSDVYMPAGVPEYISIPAGSYISAIQDAAGGNLHVTEME